MANQDASGCSRCFEEGEQAKVAGDTAAALRHFERGCELDDAASCHAAGRLFFDEEPGVPDDFERGTRFLTRACEELGHGPSCEQFGVPLLRTENGQALGRRLLASGCENGHARSCTYVGGAYQQALGGDQDPTLAARAFDRACELGDAEGCTQYGIALTHGRGVPEDHTRALALYARACDGGDPIGCGNHGVGLWKGIGGPIDLEGAVRAFERGCEIGNANSCNGLGVAYLRGEGVASDPVRALQLFERSCEGGESIGCENAEGLRKAGAPAAEPAETPRWTTTIGSLTIGSGGETATFEDVRSTCNPLMLSLSFGAAASDVRSCLAGDAKRRVSLAVEEGRVRSSSAEPDDAAGRCVVGALGNAPLGSLTCAFEASVSR